MKLIYRHIVHNHWKWKGIKHSSYKDTNLLTCTMENLNFGYDVIREGYVVSSEVIIYV